MGKISYQFSYQSEETNAISLDLHSCTYVHKHLFFNSVKSLKKSKM